MIRSRPLLAAAAAILWSLPVVARAGELHEVKAADAKAVVGAKTKTSLTLVAKKGWHVNEQAPITVKLAPGPGLTVDKNRLTRADLVEKTQDQARFDVGFVATEPGKKTIDAEASFVICQETACKPVKEKVVLAVDASAPSGKTRR
jgi:hypothetical protein